MRYGDTFLRKIRRGTTLIEALATLFLFSVVTVAFYSTWSLGTSYILLVKNRVSAMALANEKIEVVRNLAFEDIAHTSGSPAGNLLQDEDVVRSGRTYHVLTQIRNQDDPYDGVLGGSPNDVAFIDYKDVRITVSWDSGANSLSVSSRFVPAGIEQPADGLGVLVVNVSSDQDGGALVEDATVRVQNTSIGFDEVHVTDNLGRLMLVGIPESIKEYQVTVSKSGYETVTTMAPYPTSSYNPVHEHASVVAGAVNTANIFQNRLAHFGIRTIDYLGADAPDISFHLSGGRKMGTDVADPLVSIYGTDTDDVTDGSGQKDYGDVSPGPYTFALTESNHVLIGMNRESIFSLLPDETLTLQAKVSPDTVTALSMTVLGISDGKPISTASIHLTNGAGYDTTVATDAIGKAFFPATADPFLPGTYEYTVSSAGYGDVTGNVTVNAGQLEEETVSLDFS